MFFFVSSSYNCFTTRIMATLARWPPQTAATERQQWWRWWHFTLIYYFFFCLICIICYWILRQHRRAKSSWAHLPVERPGERGGCFATMRNGAKERWACQQIIKHRAKISSRLEKSIRMMGSSTPIRTPSAIASGKNKRRDYSSRWCTSYTSKH